MTSDDALAKEALILDLFDRWPNFAPSADTIRAYVADLDGMSVEAVRRSVDQFRSGLVDRNNAFVPASPEVVANVREWQRAIDSRDDPGPTLHNGLLNVDFGRGSIDMRGLTAEEQDKVMDMKGVASNGRSMAGMSLAQIREEVAQVPVIGPRKVAVPLLQRMNG